MFLPIFTLLTLALQSLAMGVKERFISVAPAPPNTATVARIQGLYVFTDAAPVAPHDTIGDVHLGFFYLDHDGYLTVRRHILEKVNRKHPNAEGAILRFDQSFKQATATAIRFK